jgi:large subunit ribosomal protein L10
MNKSEKESLLKFLTERLSSSKVSIFAQFSGITVKEMEQLRKDLRKCSGNVMVVKNTLTKMALRLCSMDEAMKFMEGPNLLIWSQTGDESEVIKETLKFVKASAGKLRVNFGLLNNLLVEPETLEKLGKLPSKKIVQAMVIGSIKSPLSNLVYNVKYPLTRLILVLKTFSEQKEKKNG